MSCKTLLYVSFQKLIPYSRSDSFARDALVMTPLATRKLAPISYVETKTPVSRHDAHCLVLEWVLVRWWNHLTSNVFYVRQILLPLPLLSDTAS